MTQLKKSKKVRRIFATYVVPLLALALLIYFLPRESKFGYEYEQNRPWRYAQLIASYDFPIYKTEAELAHEKDSLARNFRPYYSLDTTVCAKQIRQLQQDFASGL